MIIELSDRVIPCTLEEQAAKVLEEWHEFNQTQVGKVDLDRLAEEGFDPIEAVVRLMVRHGVDIQIANQRHLEKMRQREAEVFREEYYRYLSELSNPKTG